MKNTVEIISKIENTTNLKSNLNLLIEYSLSNQTFIFDLENKEIEFENLIASQIVKIQSNKYHISDFETFGYCIYSKYKSENKINLTDNFNTYVSLLKEIKAQYESGKFVQNLTTLFNELWAIAILEANQNYDVDFVDYLNSLNAEKCRDDIFSFNEGYSRALPLLNIEVPQFFQNGIYLINFTRSHADYNLPLGSIIRGIRNKIKANNDWGLKCFEYSIKQPELEIALLIPIITGLYDNLRKPFYDQHLKNKISTEIFNVSIICGLSAVECIKEDECELFFEIFNQSDKGNSHVLVNIPKLMFSILSSNEKSIGTKHIEKSFELLEELLEIDNSNLIYYILRENVFQNSHLELRKNLILGIINKPHFKQEYLNLINDFLWNLKDVAYFGKVLYTIGVQLPFKSIVKNLSSSINELQSNCKTEFDKVVVYLLIQDKACCRFLATDILINFFSENYKFDFDILELTPLNQYKLWVSIFQRYREPKYILPCLLPLLKSNSPIVKEAFICKLEEYTESYGEAVTKILEQQLDFEDADLKVVFERVENYQVEFYNKNVLIKEGVKELNPFFTQNKLYIDFNKNHNRHFNRQMQKSSNKNRFLTNFFSKVILLKGGGWKIDGRDEISKLGKIGTSFSFPRTYFTRPEKFDFESSIEMTSNWDENSFTKIKWYLENE